MEGRARGVNGSRRKRENEREMGTHTNNRK
jgi:hypothetical protein